MTDLFVRLYISKAATAILNAVMNFRLSVHQVTILLI